jgi:hypothetical protein
VLLELSGFLAGLDRWPRRQQFIDADQAQLYEQVERTGGGERWAPEFGLEFEPEPDSEPPSDPARKGRRARETRRERLIRDLEIMCSGAEYFPSNADWKAIGRTDLQAFVRRNGGVQEWSKRLGLPLRSIQDRRPYTTEQALVAGRSVLARYGRIPSRATLAEIGHTRLHTFIQNEFAGDRDAFADRCR